MNMFHTIVNNDEIEVDVVCRLYLLVCFVVFFPRKSVYVSNMSYALLDDLDNLWYMIGQVSYIKILYII